MRGLYYCDWHEVYGSNLALAVAALSHDVTLIVRSPSPELRNRQKDAHQLQQNLAAAGVKMYFLPGRYWSLRSLKEIRSIVGRIRSRRYDYFHLQQTGDPRFLWVALRLPTALTLHEPNARDGVSTQVGIRRLLSTAVAPAYKRLAGLLVVHTTENLQQLSPAEQAKAIVIPHGVQTSPRETSEPSKTILFFGRAANYKGIGTLTAAMAEVWKSEPEARLRILASPGDDESRFSPSDSRIRATWDGYSEAELDAELSNARAVCLPYVSAAGTGVGSRAYGTGIPIVACDLEGIRELASHRDLVVQPNDVSDLARAILLALSRDYGPQPIDAGRTWPGVARLHVHAYESLIYSRDLRP